MQRVKKLVERVAKNARLAVCDKKAFCRTVINGLIMSLLGILTALLYGNLVSQVAENKTLGEMKPTLILAIICTVSIIVTSWFRFYGSDKLYNRSVYSLRRKYIGKLLATGYSDLTKDDSSEYINNLNNDVHSVVYTYSMVSANAVICCVTVAGAFIAAMVLDWRIGLSMVGFTAFAAVY